MKAYGSNAAAALASSEVGAVVYIQLDFDSGTQRYWTGAYDTEWNGHLWEGAGGLVEVGEVRETEQLIAHSVPLRLSGTAQSLVALLQSEKVRGRECTLWFAAIDAADDPIDSPPVEFKGRLDEPGILIDAPIAAIEIRVVSRLSEFAKPKERRYNDQDQQAEFPGDTIFDGIHHTVDMEVVWPARTWFFK